MSGLVVAWTVINVLGVALSVYLAIEALIDLRALEGLSNGRRKRTWARLASECVRLVIHTGAIVLGVVAMLDLIEGWMVSSFLIVLAVLLIVNSLIQVYKTQLEPSADSLAKAAAIDLLATAEDAAERILDVARAAAAELKRIEVERSVNRVAEAAEATADNTARIAANTEPDGGA
jgi:hypothetical protein